MTLSLGKREANGQNTTDEVLSTIATPPVRTISATLDLLPPTRRVCFQNIDSSMQHAIPIRKMKYVVGMARDPP